MNSGALLKSDNESVIDDVSRLGSDACDRPMTARQFNFTCNTGDNIHTRTVAVYVFAKIKDILSSYGYEVIKSESPKHSVELRMRKNLKPDEDSRTEEEKITRAFNAEPSFKLLKAKNMRTRHRNRKNSYKKVYKYDLESIANLPVVGLCSIAFKRNMINDIVDQKAVDHASKRIQEALKTDGWHICPPTISSDQDLFFAEKLITEPVTARTVQRLFEDVIQMDRISHACLSVAEAHNCQIEYGLGPKKRDAFLIDQSALTFCLSPTVGLRS